MSGGVKPRYSGLRACLLNHYAKLPNARRAGFAYLVCLTPNYSLSRLYIALLLNCSPFIYPFFFFFWNHLLSQRSLTEYLLYMIHTRETGYPNKEGLCIHRKERKALIYSIISGRYIYIIYIYISPPRFGCAARLVGS